MAKDIDSADTSVVDNVARDVVDRFAAGLTHLADVRASSEEIGSTVGALVRLIHESGLRDTQADPLAGFLSHAETIVDRSAGAAEVLSNGSLGETLRKMIGDLNALRARATELRSATYLTKIVCAETGSARGLDSFVRALEECSGNLRKIGADTAGAIGSVEKASAETAAALVALRNAFQRLVTETRRDREALCALEGAHVAHTALLQQSSRDLGQEVGQSVSRLLDCLQFSDAFSQRREHVVAIVAARKKSISAAERSVLGRLASAHLVAMAEDLARVTRTARSALGAILGALDRAQLEGGDAANPSTAWLQAARESNEAMRQAALAGRAHLDTSLTCIDAVLGHIDRAVAGLETSADLSADLENSARNAAIAAIRSGDSGASLQVLARNVRDIVIDMTGLVGRLTEGLALVRTVSGDLKAADLHAELSKLEAVRQDADRSAEAQADMMAALTDLRARLVRSAARIDQAARSAIAAFEQAATEGPKLAMLASQDLAEAPLEGIDDTDVDLSWVAALYTMEEERAIHRALFPEKADAALLAAVAQGEDDDLDGFLM